MKELRKLTEKEKEFLIRNNYDPKDYMFYKESESEITFYSTYFKNYWTIKKDIPHHQSKGKSKTKYTILV